MRAKDVPQHLHGRYGVRPPSPLRWIAVGLALVVAVPALVYSAGRYVATQRIPFALISWGSLDDQHVRVFWKLDPGRERQWCVLRAQDFNHFDVGFAVVPVESGVASVEYVLQTRERPMAVDVDACGTDPYDLPGPQFPPGVLPPPQSAPGFAPGVRAADSLGFPG
jgi:hypothetical protein